MEIEIEPNIQYVTWILKDFLELPQKGDSFLDSPEFVFGGNTYCLRLHPEVNRWNERKTEFHVRRLSFNFPKRKVSCKIGIRRRESTGDDWYSYQPKALEENYSLSRPVRERDACIPDGSLIMVCCMRLSEESRAGSSAQEEVEQGGFPGHEAPISSRCPPNMELSAEFPCTLVHLSVPKFLDLPRETLVSLSSPEFRFAGDTYCLRFRPNDDADDCDLQLVRLTFSVPERTLSYRVGYGWYGGHAYPEDSRSLVGGTGFCITRSKLEKKRNNYAPFGTLELLLFLGLGEQSSAGSGTSEDAVRKRTGLSDIDKLQSDYRKLLQKGTESDACVVVCGKEFKVHKNVLRARSEVFEAMFGHDTAEKESGWVVVDDLDPDSFGDFLEYVYTGDVAAGLSDDNAFDLYLAADKYDVSTLKSKCVEHMRRTLSVDYFCDVVTLALRHHEEDLLQQAISFFKDNMQAVIITAKWQQFMCDNPTSANELLIKAIVPKKQ